MTGEEVRGRREGIGLSQEELAKEAGVSYRTVLRFEKGHQIRDEIGLKIMSGLERLEKSGRKPGLWWLSRKRGN